MVGAGACCHRPVKLPETGNQEALPLSPSPSPFLSIYHNFPLCSHLSAVFPSSRLSQSLGSHSHSVVFSFSIFYLNLSVLHISPPVCNSSTDRSILLYHFPSTKIETEIVFLIYSKLLYIIYII